MGAAITVGGLVAFALIFGWWSGVDRDQRRDRRDSVRFAALIGVAVLFVTATVRPLRFDTVGIPTYNSVALLLTVYVWVHLLHSQRSGHSPSFWMWCAVLLGNVTYAGVYGPLGPIIVLIFVSASSARPPMSTQ